MNRVILWPPAVRSKLSQFRSERFSPEETFDFISQLILETEAVRIVVKRFRIYFEQRENEVWIVAVLFPGEK